MASKSICEEDDLALKTISPGFVAWSFGLFIYVFLSFRVKPSIDLFLDGMDAVGQFLTKYVRRNPKAFLQVFTSSCPTTLTVMQLKGLYHIKWSEEGSNDHAEEEDTIYCWEHFLKQVIHVEDLEKQYPKHKGYICCGTEE